MADKINPVIVYIDDKQDNKKPLKDAFKASFHFVLFDDFKSELKSEVQHLQRLVCSADIILVDLELRPDSDPNLLTRGSDGINVIDDLKAYFRSEKLAAKFKNKPRFFAIYSGKVQKLDERATSHPQFVAVQHDVDWIFDKAADEGSGASIVTGLRAMLRALRTIPSTPIVTDRQIKSFLQSTLDSPDPLKEPWIRNGMEDFYECKPPLADLASTGGPVNYLRWILHVPLPHPSFLVDARYVATVFGLKVDRFEAAVMSKGSKLRRLLKRYEYGGVFSDFGSPRWWKAGVSQFWWERTKGQGRAGKDVAESLLGQIDALETLKGNLVPVFDPDLQKIEGVADADNSVQVRPAFWPVALSEPWLTIDSVLDHSDLKRMVVSRDKERVDAKKGLGK